MPWILGRNAFGFRSRMASTAACLTASWLLLLQQDRQLQWSQYRPLAKHSQYSLRQREFLQLQCFWAVGGRALCCTCRLQAVVCQHLLIRLACWELCRATATLPKIDQQEGKEACCPAGLEVKWALACCVRPRWLSRTARQAAK